MLVLLVGIAVTCPPDWRHREGVPGQSNRLRGCVARFNFRGSRKKLGRVPITFREQLQDFSSRCTERAVSRTAFRKWWCKNVLGRYGIQFRPSMVTVPLKGPLQA